MAWSLPRLLCTQFLFWFIWTLNLASLQPAIGPLGWDNWFCISHRDGWNNIQDGRDDLDLANPFPAAAPHFDLLPVCQGANLSGFDRCPTYIRLKSADSEWAKRERERERGRGSSALSLRASSKELNMQLWPQGAPHPAFVCSGGPRHLLGNITLSFSTHTQNAEIQPQPQPVAPNDLHHCFVIICCSCVWIHRVPHKSHIEF